MSETAPLATPVLLASLVRELTLLVGQTLSLARTEVSAARREVSLAALGMAVSALVALFGALVLVAALVLIVVALGAPAWAATLGVGVFLAGGGGAAGWIFYSRFRRAPVGLPDTRASLSETMTWLKAELKR